eukprot:CAMPEP_0113683504 /NCGR_PEP_ID=MMETSP0038_2-20120614/13354_1 /TAXON_ID=2898 /ORGANISM="Cryptomonas paramecium" /LENGTH=274 /DNA_ID=CAMNT_0000602889 /DNA_START=188 /DNA_END=1007 /DNA_ORIENTATION=- /assembly_acc=CAM_ASM_000170
MCTGKFDQLAGQPTVRAWPASGEVTVGTCIDLFKSVCTPAWNVTCLGPTSLQDAATRTTNCQDDCDSALPVCQSGCDSCSGDCLCACRQLNSTCAAGCAATRRACALSNYASGSCSNLHRFGVTAANLSACCDEEYQGCFQLCNKVIEQCTGACWRSYTYTWNPPGPGSQCARTCGTNQVWKQNNFFRRDWAGVLAGPMAAADLRFTAAELRQELPVGALLMIGDEIVNVSAVASCAGGYPCNVEVDVKRAAGGSTAAAPPRELARGAAALQLA